MIGDFYGNAQVADDGSVRAGAVSEVKPAANVYVDAVNGDNGNNGSTELLAKRTIPAAIAVAAPCDTVVALPGDYDDGSDSLCVYDGIKKADVVLEARVRVPDGVTLKASGSAEDTVIYGAKSPTGSTIPEFEGCGEGALRCAIVEAGGTIEGFTLRGGRTTAQTENWKETYGAGVYGLDSEKSLVKNFILTDLVAGRGAGGYSVTFDRCVITNAIAFIFASGGIFCSAYNTFFDDLRGSRMMDYYGDIVNCTIGSSVCNTNRTAVHTLFNPYGESPKVWNLLSLCDTSVYAMSLTGVSVKNCVFPKAVVNTYDDDAENIITNRTRTQLLLDYDSLGRANALSASAVDAGCDTDLAGSFDLGGNARVANCAVDIGCWEADWKSAYSAKLGRNVTVTAADGDVRSTVEGNGVELAEGGSVCLTWASGAIVGCGRLSYALGAGAKLSVTVNGVTTELSSGSEFDFKSALASQTIVVACSEGSVTLNGFRRISGTMMLIR